LRTTVTTPAVPAAAVTATTATAAKSTRAATATAVAAASLAAAVATATTAVLLSHGRHVERAEHKQRGTPEPGKTTQDPGFRGTTSNERCHDAFL